MYRHLSEVQDGVSAAQRLRPTRLSTSGAMCV
jgi:hypothetical protein